jgi:hypothetical protein
MKHFTLSLIGLSLASASLAQPTFQSNDITPVIGESFVVYSAGAISPGSSGNNVTWDLSTMSQGSSTTTVYSAANAGFPGSNITATYGGSTMAYLNYGASGWSYYGMNANGTVITYQDPMQQLGFPLSNGATTSDYFHATFTNGMPFERFGTMTSEVDGYGTVITPEGTFSDVLRVHFIQDYKDSNEFIELNYYVEIYAWYKSGVHNELASISSLTYQGTTSTFAGYLETNGLGVEEVAEQPLVMWPNPGNGNITLALASSENVQAIELTDLNGKIIPVDYQLQNDRAVFDAASLDAGTYFVKISYASGHTQQGRFVRQ